MKPLVSNAYDLILIPFIIEPLLFVAKILHFENDEKFIMKPGMVFTIEPILVQGDPEMYIWSDRWTAANKDGGW